MVIGTGVFLEFQLESGLSVAAVGREVQKALGVAAEQKASREVLYLEIPSVLGQTPVEHLTLLDLPEGVDLQSVSLKVLFHLDRQVALLPVDVLHAHLVHHEVPVGVPVGLQLRVPSQRRVLHGQVAL